MKVWFRWSGLLRASNAPRGGLCWNVGVVFFSISRLVDVGVGSTLVCAVCACRSSRKVCAGGWNSSVKIGAPNSHKKAEFRLLLFRRKMPWIDLTGLFVTLHGLQHTFTVTVTCVWYTLPCRRYLYTGEGHPDARS